MKLSHLLNTYDVLNEALLTSDFSIGFELEGICDLPPHKNEQGERETLYLPGYHSGQTPSGGARVLLNRIDNFLGFGKGKIERDGSLNTNGVTGWTFEYGSPIIPFTPANLKKILSFLDALPTDQFDVDTNSSCGFHTHMSFKGINKKNAAWIFSCIAWDDDMHDLLTELKVPGGKTIQFFSDSYSSPTFLTRLQNALKQEYWSNVDDYLSNEKFRTVKLHEAGTLEWRGPRDFLHSSTDIKAYITTLFKVVQIIAKMADAKEWKGLSRKKFEDNTNPTLIDVFNSPDEKKNADASRKLINVILANPMIVLGLNTTQFNKLTEIDIHTIIDSVEDTGDNEIKKQFLLMYSKLSGTKRAMFDKQLFKRNNTISRVSDFVKYLLYKNPDFAPLMKWSKKDVMEVIGNVNSNYNIILVRTTKEPITEKDIKQMYKTKTLDDENLLKLAIDLPELSFSCLTVLANSERVDLLLELPELPKRIQEILVRRSPYFIQYINNPDPTIVNRLKAKNPDIENFIRGVI